MWHETRVNSILLDMRATDWLLYSVSRAAAAGYANKVYETGFVSDVVKEMERLKNVCFVHI